MGISADARLPGSQAEDAFEEFVRGRSTHLFRLALVLTGWDRAAAEDVLQIALERAYRHRRLLFRQGSAEPYVRRVVVNAAIDWRRMLRRRAEQPLDLAAGLAVEDRTGQVGDRVRVARRSSYLAVTDPALIRAYEQARPGAGPPAWIGSDGIAGSGPSSRLAVWLAGIRKADGGTFPQEGTFTQPAEVILAGTAPLVTYAPETPQGLSLTWGPDGLVLLRTGAGDKPGSWNAYVGTLQSSRLSQPIAYGMDGATFSPAGTVIALQDSGGVTFWPTPRPACERTARCLPFRPAGLFQPGIVQAWVQ